MRIERLPLPDPWTIETLSGYVDALISFITTYNAIACFNSSEIFTSGFPLDWSIPDYSLEQWLKIIAGQDPQNAPESLKDFLHLARHLPLKDKPDTPKLDDKRREGASRKKNHELDLMLSFLEATKVANDITTSNVLDVGCGLGLLSTELHKTGYNVVAIEGNPECFAVLAKDAPCRCINKYVTHYTDLDVIEDPCISMSLHACGNLSLDMISHFLLRDNVKLLINNTCCYNRLAEDGFPVSQYFKDKHVTLSPQLRQVAAHCLDGCTLECITLRVRKQFYRAVLEVLLSQHNLGTTVGRMRNHHYESGFQHYLDAVISKLELPKSLLDEAGIVDDYDERKLIGPLFVRAMCGAPVESLIMLDRWIAVREKLEHGYVGLHRLYDPKISPRGWALVAARS